MRIVLQRVSRASVKVGGSTIAEVGRGLLLLVAIEREDTAPILDSLAAKVVNLRVFPDEAGRMNRSSLEERTEILAVSQFTLAGSLERGRRPSFEGAATPDVARKHFEYFVGKLKESGLRVATGEFQAMMDVELINEGPVTFVLDGGRR
jgi:D-tyrosyl-tRNA(Tyr) deacylase